MKSFKKEKLIGTTTIPYKEKCFIQVLNIKEILNTMHKKEERYYSDFYNVTEDSVYFIDRIELDPFCETLGYQLINNKLVIYNYDIVVGRVCHAVKRVFKYYDVDDNININASVYDIITELGFNLSEEDRNKVELASSRVKKLEEFINTLEKEADFTNIIPLVDISKKARHYTNKQAYSAKMISPISRKSFTEYYTKMIVGADKEIIINKSVINLDDYLDNDSNNKTKKKVIYGEINANK